MIGTLSGTRIDRYLLGEQLGAGGMGEVYQAQVQGRSELVAVKVLHPEFAARPEFKARFQREMSLLAGLEHPHIIPLLDYGESSGYVYLVMHYVDGMTLDKLMRRRRFSPLSAWNVIKPLMAGLEHGHLRGVLHRDIKPGNVLLDKSNGHVFLMDFGLGKQPGIDTTITASQISIGTPEYMSPEAALGEDIGHSADIYSLAVTTYELMIGTVPFAYADPVKIAQAQVAERPPSPRDFNPSFPQALDRVIMQSLAKHAHKRHASVREFAEDLYHALCELSPDQQGFCYWG